MYSLLLNKFMLSHASDSISIDGVETEEARDAAITSGLTALITAQKNDRPVS